MTSPTVGVLALQGDVREHLRALEQCGVGSMPVGSLADLERVDALVIPGGESTTMSKLAISDGLMQPLRDARQGGMPMYGSCAGMIMLADRVTDARPDQETIGGLDVTVTKSDVSDLGDAAVAYTAQATATDGRSSLKSSRRSQSPMKVPCTK